MTAIRWGGPAAFDLIVMVASLGGLQSVSAVLAGLPGEFPVPLVVLQHSARGDGPEILAPLLQRSTDLPVRTARDGQLIAGPGVHVLPRGYTGALEAGYQLRLHQTARAAGGDELLSSAAKLARERMIGIVLTGMLADGANGVRAVKRHGGRVLAEDPRTARAGSMPSNAIATGCVDFALPKHRLAAAVMALVLAPGGAELFSVPTPAWATLDA